MFDRASFLKNTFTLPAPVATIGQYRRWWYSISPSPDCTSGGLQLIPTELPAHGYTSTVGL